MAYNSQMYFPQNYGGYQMYQPQMQVAQTPTMQPQSMTPPTIHAEIIQVENEQAAVNYPVGAGASQMMIARDESAIFVKTATANGQATLDVFLKRPSKPVAASVDLSEYVRRDEIPGLVASIMAAQVNAEKTGVEVEVKKPTARKGAVEQ